MKNTTKYDKQAAEFCEKTRTKITVAYNGNRKYFHDDKQPRDCYVFTITKGKRAYVGTFGQSITSSGTVELINPDLKRRFTGDITPEYGTPEFLRLADGYHCGKDYKRRNRIEPSAYDILAAVTKTDPGTFEDFCAEYGYDTDSISAKGVYEAVRNEYLNLARLFSDAEFELMAEMRRYGN